jgi:large subunit ribosomal protein L10
MLRERKTQIVAQLADSLSRSRLVIATSYQGLTAKELANFRWALADATIECRVVKNTLVRLAARKVGMEQIMNIVDGPTALTFGYDDAARAAKVISQCIRSRESAVGIKGGLLGERVLNPQEVVALASLPPREWLVSQLVSQLQAPIRRFHDALRYPLQGLRNVLEAMARELAYIEEGGHDVT